VTSKKRPASRSAGRTPARPAAQRPAAARPGKPQKSQPGKAQPAYRMRRFPPLPWRLKAALALGWLAAVALIAVFVPTWPGRIGLVVVATAVLPLIVVLVRDPSRRTR